MKKIIFVVLSMVVFILPAFAVTDDDFVKERNARMTAEYNYGRELMSRVQLEANFRELQTKYQELESKVTGTNTKKNKK